MKNIYASQIEKLKQQGRYRTFPDSKLSDQLASGELVDFSSNDYMGLGAIASLPRNNELMTSSASRMLATCQRPYLELERLLYEMFGRPALLFNSGYHANSGLIPALAIGNTLIVSDKLIHASIIDGIRLTHTQHRLRFKHNDIQQLKTIVAKHHADYDNILVITESIFSMDGDEAPLQQMIELKRQYDNVLLYVDIAHSLGVIGKDGIGFADGVDYNGIDIIVGTFGKACASMGAFVVASQDMIDYLRNTARSLIFSTALPPACIEHTKRMLLKLREMDAERRNLSDISAILRSGIEQITGYKNISSSHIVPLIVGNAKQVVEVSTKLREMGFLALPIRKPTVPEGTERIRFSLSASHSKEQIKSLVSAIDSVLKIKD